MNVLNNEELLYMLSKTSMPIQTHKSKITPDNLLINYSVLK